jgi:hypothetical protein
MIPLEYLWIVLTLFFAVVGVVRGFLKELGVTIVVVATLFGLDRLIPVLEQLIRDGKLQFIGLKPFTGDAATDQPANLLLVVVFELLIWAAVFIAYQGETLAYEGKNPKFPVGLLLGAVVGGVNGYLITGTVWWILDRYHYPIATTVVQLPGTLTQFAADFVKHGLLPMDLLGDGVQSIDSFGLLSIILVILIILKVVR